MWTWNKEDFSLCKFLGGSQPQKTEEHFQVGGSNEKHSEMFLLWFSDLLLNAPGPHEMLSYVAHLFALR